MSTIQALTFYSDRVVFDTAVADRVVFDTAVGENTVLTLNEPDPGTWPCNGLGFCTPTYGNGLLISNIDYNPGCGVEGNICFGALQMSVEVSQPVTAFGFDVTDAVTTDNNGAFVGTFAVADVMGQRMTVDAGHFYGWQSTVPFDARVDLAWVAGREQSWNMDNVAIQVVGQSQQLIQPISEPSTVLFLLTAILASMLGLGWRRLWRQA